MTSVLVINDTGRWPTPVMSTTTSTPWLPGTFRRDTAIYSLGVLGEVVLRRALALRAVSDRYQA